MGASPHLRWVAIAAALWLVAAPAAVAQSPSGPDAAPSSGSSHSSGGGPSPDPAPVKSKPAVVKRAVVPAAAVTSRTPVQSTPAPTVTTPAAKATVKKTATRHRKNPVRRKHRAATPPKPRRSVAVHAPSLPRLTPVRLVVPTTDGDASRARELAAGALSLLVLSLASAMLLAVAARGERRRVVR
jgi:hypothetical protein